MGFVFLVLVLIGIALGINNNNDPKPLCETASYTLYGAFAHNLEHKVWIPIQNYAESWFDAFALLPSHVTKQKTSFAECSTLMSNIGPYDKFAVLIKTYLNREPWYMSEPLRHQLQNTAVLARLVRCVLLRLFIRWVNFVLVASVIMTFIFILMMWLICARCVWYTLKATFPTRICCFCCCCCGGGGRRVKVE